MTDRDVDTFIEDARAQLEGVRGSGRRRDFADVVERAHAMDPTKVPDHVVTEAQSYAPVLALARGTPKASRDPALLGFEDDVRGHLEDTVAARRLHGVPPMRSTIPPARRRVAWLAGALALASAVVLVAGSTTGALFSEKGDRTPTQSSQETGAERERGVMISAELELELEPAAPRRRAAVPVQPPPQLAPPEPEPESEPRLRPQRSEPDVPKLSPAEQVAALDDAARAAWREGNLDVAERRFREVVRIGGSDPLAELAFSDLFTLAQRNGVAADRRRLWTAYLGRFHAGRFVDDARAGLCRTEPDEERGPCWLRYLEEFPAGAHRGAAERALAHP